MIAANTAEARQEVVGERVFCIQVGSLVHELTVLKGDQMILYFSVN
jgi:hypothetical protein